MLGVVFAAVYLSDSITSYTSIIACFGVATWAVRCSCPIFNPFQFIKGLFKIGINRLQ